VLEVDGTFTCTATGVAVSTLSMVDGVYRNESKVVGTPEFTPGTVEDKDPSHYKGVGAKLGNYV